MKLFHPRSDLLHADAPNLGDNIPVSVHEHRLEHVRQHVLDLFHVLLQLLALGHQHLQPVRGTLVLVLCALAVVLPRSVVQVDADGQRDVHQGGHQLERSQGARVPECSDLGVRELGEQGDDVVHEVLVVDDAVLALLNQQPHKIAEVCPELFPVLAGGGERVLARLLLELLGHPPERGFIKQRNKETKKK